MIVSIIGVLHRVLLALQSSLTEFFFNNIYRQELLKKRIEEGKLVQNLPTRCFYSKQDIGSP